MNIQQSVQLASLQMPKLGSKTSGVLTREQMAEKIFKIAASEGTPIEDISPKKYANRWLASDYYVLLEIDAAAVALPGPVRNQEKVARHMKASAITPIVVDINKRKVGGTIAGYVPEIIVVDGSERHHAATVTGKEYVMAWVGCRAQKRLKRSIRADHNFGAQELQSKLGEALREKFKNDKSVKNPNMLPSCWVTEVYPFENYFIYSYDGNMFKQSFTMDEDKRTVALTGKPVPVVTSYKELKAKGTKLDSAMLAAAMPRQDAPVNNAAPNSAMPGMKGNKLYADKSKHGKDCDCCDCMSAAGKSCKGMKAGLTKGQELENTPAPGAGVGPHLPPDKGASNSSLRKGNIKADDFVGKIRTKDKKKKMSAEAPPGREAQVKDLKKKVGVPGAFKIAWDQFNKGKHKK